MRPAQQIGRGEVIASFALMAVVVAVFAAALQHEFVHWDDDINVYENPRIQKLGAANLAWMFGDVQHALRYKPLSWLTWAILHSLFGLNPTAFHAANVLLHALNTALLFLLLRKLFQAAAPETAAREPRALTVAAALGALLWAVHPLRVEPVAWVTGLPYCQSMFFLLVSLLMYLEAVRRSPGPARKINETGGSPLSPQRGEGRGEVWESQNASAKSRSLDSTTPHPQSLSPLRGEGSGNRRWSSYWLSVAAFALAILTYPIVLSAVAAFVVIDLFVVTRIQDAGWKAALSKRIWLEKIPFAAMTVALLAVALVGRMQASGEWVRPQGMESFTPAARLMQAAYVWVYYFWKEWAPINLSPVYDTLVSFRPSDWPFALSAILLAVITLAFGFKWKQWPLAAALWICHLALLVPVLGLTEHPHYANDRYSYLAGTLWSVLAVFALMKFWPLKMRRSLALAGVVVAAITFGALAFQQTRVWKNSETLFRHMLATLGSVPSSGPIHVRYGNLLAVQGREPEVVEQFTAAVRAHPIFPEAHAGLATTLVLHKRAPEAVVHYWEALHLKPDWPETLNNLAWLLATHPDDKVRDGTNAVLLAERACKLTGGNQPQLLGTLAAAYAEIGRYDDAIATAQKAIALANAAAQREVAAKNEELLQLYRARKPVRDTP